MTLQTRPQVSVSPRPLPGDLAALRPATYQGRAALDLVKSNPRVALELARALSKSDRGKVALRAGDAALLLSLPDLAQDAYNLAKWNFRSYTLAGALGRACARYGLALVAYGLGHYWQALGEIDAALGDLGEWYTLQDNGLGAILEALGKKILLNTTMHPQGELWTRNN